MSAGSDRIQGSAGVMRARARWARVVFCAALVVVPTSCGTMLISKREAIRIAHTDALKHYADLDSAYAVGPPYGKGEPYAVLDSLRQEWTVRFDLLQTDIQGGGPAYRIDARSGRILRRLLTQ